MAFLAAAAVALLVIKVVRALTQEQLGLSGGTLAGMACALIAVFGVYAIVNRFPEPRDSD